MAATVIMTLLLLFQNDQLVRDTGRNCCVNLLEHTMIAQAQLPFGRVGTVSRAQCPILSDLQEFSCA